MKKAAILLLVIVCFLVSLSDAGEKKEEVELQEIYVRPGDTLHGISTMYLEDPNRWPEIYKYNTEMIKNPDLILPAMRIKVPVLMVKEHLRPAHLINIIRDVRSRTSGKTDWEKAELGMKLLNEDGIRTLEKSIAQIKFYSGEIMKLGENSLIILRPEEKREEAKLMEGELRATRAKVITVSAIIEPRIAEGAVMPEFKARINEDRSTQVSVYKGEVDFTSEGKTVVVPQGFMSHAKFREPPAMPVALPPMPDLKSPSDMRLTAKVDEEAFPSEMKLPGERKAGGEIKDDKFFPEPVSSRKESGGAVEKTARREQEQEKSPAQEQRSFAGVFKDDADIKDTLDSIDEYRKKGGTGIRLCHLQIATDINFENVIVDKKMERTSEYETANLPNGGYFWRISYINDSGVEGPYSDIRSFVISEKNPMLEVISPAHGAYIKDDFVTVKARTERGNSATINGESVYVDKEGIFMKVLYLTEGENGINMTVRDGSGRMTIMEVSVRRGGPKAEPGKTGPRVADSMIIGLVTIGVCIAVILLLPKY